jgi:hypothetical protein
MRRARGVAWRGTHHIATVLDGAGPVQTEVPVLAVVHVVLQEIQHLGHLAEKKCRHPKRAPHACQARQAAMHRSLEASRLSTALRSKVLLSPAKLLSRAKARVKVRGRQSGAHAPARR